MCFLKKKLDRAKDRHAKHGGRRAALEILLFGILVEMMAVAPVFGTTPDAGPESDLLNPLTGGLLFYTTQAPVQQMRMAFLHQGPELPRAGQWTIAVDTVWSNTWIDDSREMIDDEAWWINPVVEYGVTDRWAVSLATPVVYLSGGVLDSAIESFHRDFHLGDEGRNQVPRNQLNIGVWEKGRFVRIFDDADDGFYARAPVLSTCIGLAGGDLPATLKVSISVPTLERKVPGLTSNAPDVGVSIAASYHWAPNLSSTASVAYIHSRAFQGYDVSLQDWAFSGAVNLAYRESDATSVILQLLQETAVGRESRSGLDSATSEIIVGVRHRASENVTMELGFVENAFVNDNAADIALFMSAAQAY